MRNTIFSENRYETNITLYQRIPFDAEFYAEFEFEVKIFYSTHAGEKSIWKFCVGESQKF